MNEIRIENKVYFDKAYQHYMLKSRIYYKGKYWAVQHNIEDIMFHSIFDEAWKIMGEELKNILQHEKMGGN